MGLVCDVRITLVWCIDGRGAGECSVEPRSDVGGVCQLVTVGTCDDNVEVLSVLSSIGQGSGTDGNTPETALDCSAAGRILTASGSVQCRNSLKEDVERLAAVGSKAFSGTDSRVVGGVCLESHVS